VRSTSLLVALLAAAVAPATAVGAGPAGFSDPVAIGSGGVAQTAGALSADGHGAVAWTGLPGRGATLSIALRDGAGQPWRTSVLGLGGRLLRDPQAVVTPDGDAVVAWGELADAGRRQTVAVVAAPAGGQPGAVRRFAVGNGFGAFPRVVVLPSGAVLLAFRDATALGPGRLRVALRPASGDRFGAPRTVATRASSLAVARSGGGAVMAWTTPRPRTRAGRTLYALRLDGRGRAGGAATIISRSAGGTEVRLAGSPDGQSIVSWLRPRASGGRPAALFTRMFEPSLRPARPLQPPVGTVFGGPAAVAIGLSGRAMATATALGGEPTGVRVFGARSAFGGPWTGDQELSAQPSPSTGDPRPLLFASGEAVVFWTQARTQPGAVSYDVLVARRAPAQVGFAAPQSLSASSPAGQPSGLVVATGGEHVLVAWPGAAGDLLAVERG
jgi:hypothetical protein